MSKMEYMPVDCLQVPKVLFQMEKYKNLSNTAKILYSLFLDRLKFAVQNGWVDHNGNLFVIYPKSEIKKDLNTTRYGVDQAVQELVQVGKLVRIIPNNGKANHFYINGIYENEMEEESMMTLDTIMANMPLAEREIIMDKMVKASRDIFETIADMGYIDQYETSLTAMEKRGYQDELGEMDIDQIQADGYEFGMDLAFGILEENENNPARVLDIQKYVNRQYESCSKKKFMKVLETLVHAMQKWKNKAGVRLSALDKKKLVLTNLPYVLTAFYADRASCLYRSSPGEDIGNKLLYAMEHADRIFTGILLSFDLRDLLVGVTVAVILKLLVWQKQSDAKKLRKGIEYGSARWGTAEDIKPYMSDDPWMNIPLTATEALTMESRPKQPKYARNKNIVVIGGSGSGKTRFFVKPSVMQMNCSMVITDPKGLIYKVQRNKRCFTNRN